MSADEVVRYLQHHPRRAERLCRCRRSIAVPLTYRCPYCGSFTYASVRRWLRERSQR